MQVFSFHLVVIGIDTGDTNTHTSKKLGLFLGGQNLLKQLQFSGELTLKFNKLVLLFVMTEENEVRSL